ncbi:hypothetical protein GQ473_04240 [archaeon]|nr:hypothetical protein [archaeon]
MTKYFGYTYQFIDNYLIIMVTFMVGYRHIKPKYGLKINLISRTVEEIRPENE